MKKVIVTGASGGIGKATCQMLLKNNFKVIAIDVSEKSLEYFKNMKNVEIEVLDISNYENVESYFHLISEDKDVMALINNAGIYYAMSLLEYDSNMMDEIWKVNIKGTTICSKFFIENLIKNKQFGKIINISSISGQEGSSDALYGLSKAAIIGLTKSLALRFSDSVLVNAIAPTMVDTKMMEKIPEWRKQEYNNHHLIKNAVTPSDIAQTIKFLLSSDGDHYTGATFDLNNGGYLR